MSKGRLQDIQDAFRKEGWDVANCEELYSIESEHIHWQLVNQNTGLTIELEFYVVGDFGEVSYDLNDLCHCVLRGHNKKLHFIKRTSKDWPLELREFVQEVCRHL